MPETKIVRITSRIPKEMHEDMLKLIPWGLRGNLVETVLRLIIDAIRQDGMIVAGAIMDGQFKLVRVDNENAPNWGNRREHEQAG